MCKVLHNALADRHIYIYIYIYTNITESRIERDYWPRFARYAHAARQLNTSSVCVMRGHEIQQNEEVSQVIVHSP